MRKNMPIEVIFFRWVVEDADPYGLEYVKQHFLQ